MSDEVMAASCIKKIVSLSSQFEKKPDKLNFEISFQSQEKMVYYKEIHISLLFLSQTLAT